MLQLVDETNDDYFQVEALLDLAFGPGRFSLSAYRLREGVSQVSNLSIVARDKFDIIVGTIRFWPICVGEAGVSALLLGPIAVHPTRQGEGLGRMLIEQGVARARQSGWRLIFLVGDAPYYARMGFLPCRAVSFPPPTDPERLLYLELVPGAFDRVTGSIRKWSRSANGVDNP